MLSIYLVDVNESIYVFGVIWSSTIEFIHWVLAKWNCLVCYQLQCKIWFSSYGKNPAKNRFVLKWRWIDHQIAISINYRPTHGNALCDTIFLDALVESKRKREQNKFMSMKMEYFKQLNKTKYKKKYIVSTCLGWHSHRNGQ